MITRSPLLVGFLMLLLLQGSPPSLQAGGVTVITHGFNGNADDWVLAMGNRMALHPDFKGVQPSIYKISVTRPSAYVLTATAVGTPNPTGYASGEIVILWDWSTLAGLFGPSTATIAEQLAAALLSTNLIPAMNGRPLAELPLHLVGHSRGASLVAETARFLGAQGVWVDHLTLLDPYPLGLNGDPSMKNYANVLFADNYWQNEHFPDGETVPGAYNRYLTVLTGGYDDTSSSHSDVHLWYHGSVDLRTPTGDPDHFVQAAQRSSWWTSLEAGGTNAGFRFSLIAGGDRFSAAELAGTGTGRVNGGLNRFWDVGAGISPNRTALPQNNGTWPNLVRCSTASGQVTAGGPLPCSVYYQFGLNTNAPAAEVRVYLDADGNPFNANQTQIHQGTLPPSGMDRLLTATLPGLVPGGIVPGSYWPFCSIRTGGKTRFLYAPGPILVQASPLAPLVLTNPRTVGDQFNCTLNGSAGDTVVLEASTNLIHWAAVQTNTLAGPSVEIGRALTPASSLLFRARRVPAL